MDEPMEECTAEICEASSTTSTPAKVSSVLRTGSMVMMTITIEDYETEYWPKLEGAINQLLTTKPGQYNTISYEQMYSCVYKCVCKQFSERLYTDLINQITNHLEKLSLQLNASDPHQYIEKFNYALNQYITALGGIVPIFNYMNRFYVECKLKTDLDVELKKLFVIYVAEKHIQTLIPLLVEANSKPFSVSPPVMANLIKNLYSLKPEFSQLRPYLFAKYIPSILPPCTESELDKYIEEAKQMQRDLLTHPDFVSGDHARKRPTEDEPPKPFPLALSTKDS